MMKHGPVYHFPSDDIDLPIKVSFIGMNHCHANYCNVRRTSKITVIGFVLEGWGRVSMNGLAAAPKKGDVFILPAGGCHVVSADPDQAGQWTYIWFNISGEFTVSFLENYRLLETPVISCPAVEFLFQQAIQLAEILQPREMLDKLPLIFHQIVLSLSNAIHLKKGQYCSDNVQRIRSYLDSHIQGHFDSVRLSRHVGLSTKQINRLFKREMKTTVYQYVLSKKIDFARTMLEDTGMNIEQIALQLGYDDPQYFSNLFKKKTGMPPSRYRTKFN